MKRKILTIVVILCISGNVIGQIDRNKDVKVSEDFLWGIGTAAYQVEGAYQEDGKGESNWDYFSNTIEITKYTIGEKQTGNIAINMYNREQYLKDIQLIKELGVTTYRFSIPWSRIIPNGTGEVNQKAIAHYHLLIKDLKAAGIEPFVTLYHFDLPNALQKRGGWSNRDIVEWYTSYAEVIFKEFGSEVKQFATFNETTMEFFVADYMINPNRSELSANVRYSLEINKVHHQLLASASAIRAYHQMNLKGSIGITFNLAPCLPFDKNNPKDISAAELEDELLNRIVLDPTFKGVYPKNALSIIQKHNPEFLPSDSDMEFIATNKPDFLGVNFYAPALVKDDPQSALGVSWLGNNTDEIKMSNGPVRPDELYELLIRLKNDYGNPIVYITENGASFKNGEDQVINGKVDDKLRSDYIEQHIAASLKAKSVGANLKGYFIWSGWDNFEWIFGYTVRFGIIYVDYNTQQRTPKKSYFTYQQILKQHK